MRVKKNYIMNEKTVLLKGETDKNGMEITQVVEGHKRFLVLKPPIEIIKEGLLHVGSNLEKELSRSSDILGPMKMYPLCLDAKKGIFLVPTKPLEKQNAIWFSLTHVKGIYLSSILKTVVHTSFGHSIVIDMKESSFKYKRQKANQLRESITKTNQYPLIFYLEPKTKFFIRRWP